MDREVPGDDCMRSNRVPGGSGATQAGKRGKAVAVEVRETILELLLEQRLNIAQAAVCMNNSMSHRSIRRWRNPWINWGNV